MSKNGPKINDRVGLVLDDRVIQVLFERLTTCLSPNVKALVNKFIEKFEAKLEELVEKLSADYVSKSCDKQSHKIVALKTENEQLKLRLDGLEGSLRLENLVIHGLN